MSLVKKLCSPSSVALIGVSRKTGKGALNPLQVLLNFGYKGRIYPVNPSADEILGYKCYRKVQEIPEIPDVAVIMVSREIVPSIVRDCAEKGIKIAVIISDGFAEADEKGKLLQDEILNIHKETGIRILGPNSMGVVNHYSHFTTSFVPVASKVAPVAFIGQSGLFVQGFSHLYIGKSIDIGNGCDIGFSEIISDLLDDPEIKIIAVHIEELKDPLSLLDILKKKSLKKPIVAFKSGRSKQAEKAIMSHSGSIAGDYMIYKAFFERCGIIPVESTQELEDVVYLLLKVKEIPEGRRVGIITPSGGAGIICLDSIEENEFLLADLSKESIEKIKKIYPDYYNPSNPLDIMSASFRHGYRMVYTEALNVMLEDENVDIVFCINGVPTLKTIGKIISEKDSKKPVISWVIGEYRRDEVEDLTKDISLPVFTHPERAFRALNICVKNRELKSLRREKPDFIEISKDSLDKIENIFKDTEGYLSYKAFDVLKAISLSVPKYLIIKDIENFKVEEVFKELKAPICMKFEAEDVFHKKRKGLIRLGIEDPDELKKAYEEISSKIPKEKINVILFQEMIEGEIELFIGIKKDPKFGHIMMIGKGGTDVELYRDIEPIMIPFNRKEAGYIFKRTKIAKSVPKELLDKFLDVMIAISTLCIKFPQIKEMDLNPIILNKKGAWIVDAKIFI